MPSFVRVQLKFSLETRIHEQPRVLIAAALLTEVQDVPAHACHKAIVVIGQGLLHRLFGAWHDLRASLGIRRLVLDLKEWSDVVARLIKRGVHHVVDAETCPLQDMAIHSHLVFTRRAYHSETLCKAPHQNTIHRTHRGAVVSRLPFCVWFPESWKLVFHSGSNEPAMTLGLLQSL